MFTQMRLWGQFDLSHRARKHVLSTYVWSRAWFLAAYTRLGRALCALPVPSGTARMVRVGLGADGVVRHTRLRALHDLRPCSTLWRPRRSDGGAWSAHRHRAHRPQRHHPRRRGIRSTAHRGAANRVPPDAARDPPRLPMRLCLRQWWRQAFQMAARDSRRFRQKVGETLHTGQRQAPLSRADRDATGYLPVASDQHPTA